MKKVAKAIRIITVAPLFALLLILWLHFANKAFTDYLLYIALFSIVVLPILAYPVQKKFHIIKGDKRSSERSLAIIFSVIGYILGFTASIILEANDLDKIVYLTYLLSGMGILTFTFLIKINASGHMCGVAGPIAILIYVFGIWCLILGVILFFIIWSSLFLKRHKVSELLIGSLIPIISLFISMVLIQNL